MSKKRKLLIGVLLVTVVIMAICTQYYADLLDYDPILGHEIIRFNKFVLYQPFAFLFWFISFNQATPVAVSMTLDVLLWSCVVLYLPLMLIMGKKEKVLTLHGTADWMDEQQELVKAQILPEGKFKGKGSLGKGIFLGIWHGKYLQHNGLEHAIVMAPTRSGKGVGLIIPTLLSWRHSSIVMDIKGENWGITAGFRQKYFEHKVLNFNPSDNSKVTCRFNPLAEIRIGTSDEVMDTQIVAKMLIETGKGTDSYWEQAASSFVTGVILHLLYSKKLQGETACLADVLTFLTNPNRNLEDVLDEDMRNGKHVKESETGKNELKKIYGNRIDPNHPYRHPIVAEKATEMLNKADKERASVMSSVTTPLALFQDPVVAKNTSFSDFKITDLMNYNVPVDLYLVIPPDQILRLMPFMRIVLVQIVSRLAPKMEYDDSTPKAVHKYRLLLMLDEFPALGNLDSFEAQLAYIAGYGIKAFLVVQSINQINKIYTEKNSILDNCHISIFYAPNDQASAELISRKLGNKTVEVISESWSGMQLLSKKNYSKSQATRPLMTPAEISTLDPTKKIIFVTGHKPLCCAKNPYYQDDNFVERYTAAKAPYVSDFCVSEEAFKKSREADKAFEITEVTTNADTKE